MADRYTAIARGVVVLGLVCAAGAAVRAADPGAAGAAPSATAQSFYGSPFEKRPNAATLTALGRTLFADKALSASGRMACASCHDPAHAYGPPNDLSVQLGGKDGTTPGLRAVPSLRYAQDTPPFNAHFSDTDGDDSADQGPAGGWTWDGRANSAHAQAEIPLLSPLEMANADRAAVVARLRASPSARAMQAAFGVRVLEDERLAWNGLLMALETFQQSPQDFYPYSSKYDDFLHNRASLSPQETRGMALFNDPAKANCAQCHISAIKRGAFPQFTDRGLIALAVPRNPQIAANARPGFYDLGLCGPLRTDLKGDADFCGLFKTPSLRNAATRKVFFHNGQQHSLEGAVRFYAERDAYPARYYRVVGRTQAYNDLPPRYHANINRDAPFAGQRPGHPSLSDAEIKELVAFLETLTDKDAKVVPTTPPSQAVARHR